MKHNFFKFLLAGMVLLGTSINLWAWDGTFYCVPKAMWGDDWSSSKTVKLNVRRGDGDNNWVQQTMSGTGRYYKGNEIYSTTVTTFWYDHCGNVQFQRYNGSTQEHSWQAYEAWQELSYFNSRLFPGNAGWQDYKTDPVINYAHLYYTKNGESKNYKFDGDKSDFDLGTITSSFTVTNIYINFNKNGGQVCATKDNGAMCYKVNDDTDTKYVKPSSDWTWSGTKDPYELQWTNASKTIASSTDPSGKYTLHIWWELKGDYAGESNCTKVTWYYSNSGKNYNWTYTILPPAVSNFGVTPSGAVAGMGTSSDPFIMPYNGTLTLTVNSLSQAHTDANSTLSLTGTANSKAITPNNNVFNVEKITNTSSTYSVTISAKYHNSSANLDGAESKVTYYYKTERYDVTLMHNDGTENSTKVTVGLYSTNLSKPATAPTRTGYELDGYYTDNVKTTLVASKAQTPALQASVDGYTNESSQWTRRSATSLYAGWTAKTYEVTLEKGGSSTGVSKVTATFDAAMPTASAPSLTGYDFAGYYDGQNGTGTKYYNNDMTSAHNWDKAENATLYAYYTPKTYTITLEQTHATTQGTTSVTATYNAVLPTIETLPQRTGYTFGGYNTNTRLLLVNAQGEWQANVEGFTDAEGKWIKNNTATLTPIWNPITTTVTINMNGGDNENQQISATFDVALNISGINQEQVTKTGYSFKGLYTAASNGSYIVDENWVVRTTVVDNWLAANGIWKNPNTSATLYVQWTPNDYTITLNNNGADDGKGGTTSVTATFDANTNLTTAITIPEKQFNTFGGYYIGDVQLIDAGGNFVPSVDGYTDASKNWKHAGDVELLAKWTPSKQCTVTFGITDGTDVAEYGTLTATVNSESFTSGSQVPSGTTIVFTWVNKDGRYSSGNAYTFGKWYDGKIIATANELTLTRVGTTGTVYSYTITDDINIYQAPTVNTYTITSHTANPVAGGEITAESWNVGPVVPCVVTATANPGYTFSSWTLGGALKHSEAQSTLTTSPITLYSANSGERTVTANFTANTTTPYTVKHYKQNLDDTYPTEPTETDNLTGTTDTEVTPSTKEYEGFTAPSTKTVTIAGNGSTVVEYQYTRNSHILTWAGLEGATITAEGTPAGSVKFDTPLTAPMVEKTGYTFNGWNPEVAATMPDNDVTYTAQWTEFMSALSTAVNAMGTTAEQANPTKSVENIGVTTTANITAEAAKAGYTFEGWTLTNCERTDNGLANALEITIKGLGNTNPATVTANYAEDLSTNWKLVGDDQSGSPFGDGWKYSNGKPMTKAPGHSTENIAYYSLNVTTLGTFDFKVAKATGNENFYGWGENGDDHITFNRDASGTEMQVYSGNQHPLKFTPDMVGEYVFKVDYTTNDIVKVTVTYPTTTTYNVDVYYDGVTKTTVEGGAFAKSITAQVPESMQFDHWEVEGETSNVQITNTTSQTTTFTASGTGAIIRAKFNTNQRIYFKDGVYDKFGNVWVTFRTSDYWDDKNGSGNKDLPYAALPMTKINNTDIHYFCIDDTHKDWDEVKNGIVQFTNSGTIQQNFYYTKVAYPHHNNSSSCYRACLPLFVPRDWITTNINSSQYYNDGIWMKYNSTESGFRIKGSWDGWTSDNYKFVAETPGGYEFKTTLHLAAGTTYDFKIYDDDNRTYSISGVMTATSCTNWHMYMDQANCQITASETGDYTFILNLGSGEVIVSVEYPLSNNDYHVVAKEGETVKWVGDLIKNSGSVAKKDTTSFFNNNYTYQLQKYAGGDNWTDIGSKVTITDDKAKVGVINLIVTQDESGNATLTYEGVYKGNYYIRTDGVDGGWGSYKTNPDNKMDNYGSSLVADPTYQYDVYKAKWVLSGKNVKFRIANDYSKAISDELKADDIIGNKETLPQGANVRFMWNSKTNQLKRAYISGSTDTKDRYLVLEGDAKMFDNEGNVIPIGTVENHREGLLANELPFTDKNNWVYQADIKAKPGCAVKLTAKYNNQVQYFIGAAGEETGSRKTIIAGNGETQYTMRVVYDFKTNLLIAGWVPDGKEITDTIKLGGDMLISRTHQDSAQQIIFGATGSIEDINHIYGVLSIKKDTMLGNGTGGAKYTTVATNADYDRTMYWVSFPFKVKISEIFGVDGYGTKWIMQKYRGDLRAQKGWFKEDTPTFWEYMDVTDSLNAYEGYLFIVDANYFNTLDADVWKNSATEANFYFPSASGNIGIINKSEYTQEVPAHACGIDREFEVEGGGTVNHKNTDSYWNVIGVPAFQNKSMALSTTEVSTDMKAIYEWNSTNNTYTPHALQDAFRFQTMHAYMVQFGGDITWSDVSVVNNPSPAQGGSAPRYAYADTKNYFIKLFFGNTEAEDHAYINLSDEASTDFVLNEDMMKIDNAGFPNIYSFAGAYDVAYNETKMENQSVMLGVSAPKDGSYTFAMPKEFSGKVVLVDLESGEATDLNLSNYTVELNKGTYNNRFQLMLEVEAKIPTNIENANGEWNADGKTKKLLINDQIYLINAGRIYNATGTKVK